MLVTPSEYVDLRQPNGTAVPFGENRVSGTVQHMNQIGHVIHMDWRLNGVLAIKIETHREKVTDKGVILGAVMDLCCRVDRATVVLDKL